jgi:single-strand DNA-binding protein
MNVIHLCGRLGKDPELKYTAGGTPVCKFSLATTNKYKDKETVEWHNLVVWGKLAEVCSKWLSKGQQAIFHGRLTYNLWEKNGVKHKDAEVLVEKMEFVGSPGEKKQEPEDPGMDLPF